MVTLSRHKKGLTMSSFARAKASLSRLHILEVPLYTFLQEKCVQHQCSHAERRSQHGYAPARMPVSMHYTAV